MDKVCGNINGFSFATSPSPCRGLIIRQCPRYSWPHMLKVAPCTVVQSYGRMVVWLYGCMVVRSYGRTVVRSYSCTVVWLYSYMVIQLYSRTSRFFWLDGLLLFCNIQIQPHSASSAMIKCAKYFQLCLLYEFYFVFLLSAIFVMKTYLNYFC